MGTKIKTYCSPNCSVIKHIVGFIHRVEPEVSLDIAMYSITHSDVLEALVHAHTRGVKCRILVDNLQASSRYSIVGPLIDAGILVRRDTKPGLMHHKFAIEGRNAVYKGSFNWTVGADTKNQEYWEINKYKYVIDYLQRLFNKMWIENAP